MTLSINAWLLGKIDDYKFSVRDATVDFYEHHLDMVGVGGSSPLGRTILLIYLSPYRVILPVVSSLLDRSISHVDCAELPPSTIRNAT